MARVGRCARCDVERQLSVRQLCADCRVWAADNGKLDFYPGKIVRSKAIVEEMESPAMRGRSYMEIAVHMGLSVDSARTSYARARRRGLV